MRREVYMIAVRDIRLLGSGHSGLGSANPWVQSHGRRAAHSSEKGVHARASHQEQQTRLVACQPVW